MDQPAITPPTGVPDPNRPPRTECGHWVGAETRYCRAKDGLRYFQPGMRCPNHTPAALAGSAEPPAGPGWPSQRLLSDATD
ncbi:hypothetical protein [Streptomyces antimycoticus]|uniref:hypothetical protein n=1 Tax=Streptomyces antimycoticus TaxID=68175 RepID=UPI00386CB130|nr:hypothetical protein OG751_23035 [Streptomyces antimycoticus]